MNKETKQTVAQSHSRIRDGFFKKARDMSLEISPGISPAVDIVLLTFILVWVERQNEKVENPEIWYGASVGVPLSSLPVED